MERRSFLQKAGVAIGAGLALPALTGFDSLPLDPLFPNFADVRGLFLLEKGKIHMAQMLLASHPTPVRNAIEYHRKMFDANSVEYWEKNFISAEEKVLAAAAAYLNADPGEIALTDSTTQGLGTLYSGFKLKPDDEILTTTHDHYSTEIALEYASKRSGATIKRVALYDNPAQASVDEITSRLVKAIKPKTKLIAVTWVHSCSGVKLPIQHMAHAIREVNSKRKAADRIYFAVDGVHGFGIEDVDIQKMGCDFFVAGTHKWLFGPRGTGIMWAKKDAWDMVTPTIPPFSIAYGIWLGEVPEGNLTFSDQFSPGGFHSFEHRWALNEAFDFHRRIGKARTAQRTHQLSTLLKDGLQDIKHVKLHTPRSPELSSGINCFDVNGMKQTEVIQKLHDQHIIGSTTPYRISYARLAPCIINTDEEVLASIKAIERLKA